MCYDSEQLIEVIEGFCDPYFIKIVTFLITLDRLHNWPLQETLKKSEYSFVVLKRSISKEVVL